MHVCNLSQTANVGRRSLRRQRLMIVLLLLFSVGTDASAQLVIRSKQSHNHRYGHNNRNSLANRARAAAAAAKARRTQEINIIQRQLVNVREVLKKAQSAASMDQAEVKRLMNGLQGLHSEIEAARDDARQAAKTRREVEAEILAEQSEGSEFGKAEAAVSDAQDKLHQAIHKVIPLPDDKGVSAEHARITDLAKLTASQRTVLEADENYQAARQQLKDLTTKRNQVRQKLFEADADWVEAQKHVTDAHEREKEAQSTAGRAQRTSLGTQKELRQAQDVVRTANSIIAQGEARLRWLGAKPAAQPAAKQSPGKNPKKKTK